MVISILMAISTFLMFASSLCDSVQLCLVCKFGGKVHWNVTRSETEVEKTSILHGCTLQAIDCYTSFFSDLQDEN